MRRSWHLRHAPVRVQLALLVVAAALPAFLAFVWYLLAAREQAQSTARARVQALAEDTAERVALVLGVQERLMRQLAQQPGVQTMDPAHCDPLLKEYSRLQPYYLTLVVRDATGHPVCSLYDRAPPRERVREMAWFQDSLRAEGFFVGNAEFAPTPRRWIAVTSVPVLGADGQRAGMLILPIDLLQLNEQVMRGLPAAVTVTVSDRRGTTVMRSQDAAHWISRPAPVPPVEAQDAHWFAGVLAQDDAGRLVAQRPMSAFGWQVIAEMPRSTAFQDAERALRQGLMVGGALLLAVLLLTWRIARGIVRPLEALAATADRVAGGDASARMPLAMGSPEVASAAHAINLMLDADHRARQALLASEERLGTALYSIGEGVLTTDALGRVDRMNTVAERLTGWPMADARGMPLAMVLRLLDADTRVALPDPAAQVLQAGREMARSQPTLLVARDGSERHVAGNASPMRNAGGGALAGVVVVVSDVSQAYRLQHAQRESERRYRALVEESPVGILVHRDLMLLYVNPVAARLLGAQSPQEMLGRSLLEHVPVHRREVVLARAREYLVRRRGMGVMEVPYLRVDGSSFDAQVQSSYLEFEGQPAVQVTLLDVTERLQAQRALRESEENLAITLNSIGDAVMVTDVQGRITRMNPVAERLTGWPLDLARHRPLREVFRIVDAASRAEIADPVQRVLDTGDVVGVANGTALLARDGAEYQIADSAAPIRGQDRRVVGVVLVFSDVTEQYRLQAAVREREQHYRSLVEHSPVGVMLHRLDAILYANPQALELLRAPSLEVLRQHPLTSLVGEDLREDVRRRMQRNLARREGTRQRVVRFLRLDGSEVHVELSTAYVDYEGEGAMHAVFVDVTERILALEALRRSEENLAITLQSIGDAVMATDAQGRITQMNAVAERMTGWPLAEARGRPLAEVFRIVHAQTRAPALDPVQHVLQTGAVMGLANHTALLARDGAEHQIADSAAPMRGPAGEVIGVVLVFSDVTEQYRLQRGLEQSEQRYRGVVDSTPVGIIVHRQGRVFFANPMALQILGAPSREALFARPSRDLVHPSFHPMIALRARQHESGMRQMPMAEWQYVRMDGQVIDVLAQATAIDMPDGDAIQVSFMDITPRKQAERTLQENEARYRALTQLSSDWYWEQDAQWRFTRIDGRLEEITGRPNGDYLGWTRWGLSEDELPDAVWVQHRLLLERQQEFRDLELQITDVQGRPCWLALSGTPILDGQGGFLGYRGVGRNVTEQRLAADKIHALAFYDALTELPNRRLLVERLKKALQSSTRSHHHAALLFIDLDNFKTLNDTQGHETGDMLLRQVAQRLTACVREVDTVARLGGDEFVVMIEDLHAELVEATAQASLVAHKVLASFDPAFVLAGREHRSTPSIGMTLFGDGNRGVEDLLKQADMAMYEAKAAGRNTLRLFDRQMQAAVDQRAALEADLHRAIATGQMCLHYQPVVDRRGVVVGAEALVRWQHPERGLVMPGEFIGVAETTRLILPLGRWVLEQACAQLAIWGRDEATRAWSLSVNVSAQQIAASDFVDQVLGALAQHGADAARLKLELTESVLADNVEEIVRKMEALRARRIGFALDDFGTGYSSLAYLQRLPLAQLKIDKSFVRDVLVDGNAASIARTIVSLATHLGLQVVAEGVEEPAQRGFLDSIGCHAFQGYLYGRPVAIAEFEAAHLKATAP
jgi:diguanylate cyclase (GGDEF)-like protein/PAS domain S-box-containing protein